MKRHFNAKFSIETELEICKLYLEGSHHNSIRLGKRFKCSSGAIINILKYYGIKIRDASECEKGLQVGEKHPNYKGGNICPDGYKRIYVKGVLVLEHRFKMEQKLGRKLKTTEIVHHRDGDKQNNNLKNLQIMTRAEHIRHHFDELTASRWPKAA